MAQDGVHVYPAKARLSEGRNRPPLPHIPHHLQLIPQRRMREAIWQLEKPISVLCPGICCLAATRVWGSRSQSAGTASASLMKARLEVRAWKVQPSLLSAGRAPAGMAA